MILSVSNIRCPVVVPIESCNFTVFRCLRCRPRHNYFIQMKLDVCNKTAGLKAQDLVGGTQVLDMIELYTKICHIPYCQGNACFYRKATSNNDKSSVHIKCI